MIHTNATQLLFDIQSNLPVCGGSEREPSLSEGLRQILCGITASPNEGWSEAELNLRR